MLRQEALVRFQNSHHTISYILTPFQHITETGETHLKAEDLEQRGDGPRCPEDGGDQTAEGA